MGGVFRPYWQQPPPRQRWLSSVRNVAITAPPGLAGGFGPPSLVTISPAILSPPALAGAYAPEHVVIATSPDATIVSPPALSGAFGPPALVSVSKSVLSPPALAGAFGPPSTLLLDRRPLAPPALAGGYSPPPFIFVQGTGDKTITAVPAFGGAYFPGAGNYTNVTVIGPPPALAGGLALIPVVVSQVGGATVVSPPAIAGAFFPAGTTSRQTRLVVLPGYAGAYFPGAGEYLSVDQIRAVPALAGAITRRPSVFTNQPPSVEPIILSPPAFAGAYFPAGTTMRSSTFILVPALAAAVGVPGLVGAGIIAASRDWPTPTSSTDGPDFATSRKPAGAGSSRGGSGVARSVASHGSADSDK